MEPDRFDITLRILGNEILGMSIDSKSSKKNWVVIGVITLVIVTYLVAQAAPVIQMLTT